MFQDDYHVLFELVVLTLWFVAVVMFWILCPKNHRIVNLGDDVKVTVSGNCYCIKGEPNSDGTLFYANKFGGSKMNMGPCFTITNAGSEPREIDIYILSDNLDWDNLDGNTLIPGKVHLGAGEWVEFQIRAQSHWYCRINLLSKEE